MTQGYKIKFVSDFEFDNLPFRHVKESLGCADPKTKTAWVRKSGISFVDQFVAGHELEELIKKYSDHEDLDGIRYKKGRDFVRILAPIAGGLLGGPLLGPLFGGTSAFGGGLLGAGATTMAPALGGALGGTIGSIASQAGTGQRIKPLNTALSAAGGGLSGAGMAPGIAASRAANGGFIGQTLSGVQSMLGFQPGAQRALTSSATQAGKKAASDMIAQSIFPGTGMRAAASGASSPFPAATGLSFNLLGSSRMPNIVGTNAQGATGATAGAPKSATQTLFGGGQQGVSSLPGSTNQITGAAANLGTQAGGSVAQQATTKPSLLKSIFGDDWQRTLIGTSIPLIGSSLVPTSQPLSAQQSQLFNEVVDRVRTGPQVQLTPQQQQAITAQYDRALLDARENLIRYWKGIRPGSDIENDSQFRKAMLELETEVATQKANALAGMQLGLSQQQTETLAYLADADVGVLSQQAGITYQEAQDFKRMLADLGYMVADSSAIRQ